MYNKGEGIPDWFGIDGLRQIARSMQIDMLSNDKKGWDIRKKLIEAKIKRNYLFVTGTVDIDCKYFINKIEEGINQSNHKNFVTNVKSFMTEWNYFVADPKFLKIIFPMCDFLDQCKTLRPSDKYFLQDAWGLKQCFGHFTKEHDHTPAFASGAIFLNILSRNK